VSGVFLQEADLSNIHLPEEEEEDLEEQEELIHSYCCVELIGLVVEVSYLKHKEYFAKEAEWR
jgi:hypothetical protein